MSRRENRMAKPLETVVQRLRRATAADAACDADLLRTFVRSQSEGEKVHMLAEGVMKAMLFNRLRNTAAAVLMACCACVGLTMLAGSPNASGHPQPARKDGAATTVALDRLQGHWKLASVQEDGKPIADVEMLSFFIFGNKLAVKEKKRESVHQFRLDASARPAAIDILHNAGKTYDVGICKLEGDTLFICCHPDQRPTEFAT